MIVAIIIIFVVAALFGALALRSVVQGAPAPKGAAIVHGLVAATGLVLLIVYTLRSAVSPVAPLVVLGLAALGGGAFFVRDLQGKPLPAWVAVGHALIAASGVVLLVLFATSLP